MIRLYLQRAKTARRLRQVLAAQLNDTHPSIAVAELMRLLVDEHAIDWDQAWEITQRTLRLHQPHALAGGAREVAAAALRRAPAAPPGDHLRDQPALPRRRAGCGIPATSSGRRLSLIDETGERYVRMAHLACVGSHAINGVAALHTELLKQTVLSDFHAVCAREVQQCDQWRHAAALDGAEQPGLAR